LKIKGLFIKPLSSKCGALKKILSSSVERAEQRQPLTNGGHAQMDVCKKMT